MLQLLGGHAGSTQLRHNDPRGVVGVSSRVSHGQPCAQTAGHHSNDRIACAGDIENLLRARSEVLSGPVTLNQRHTGFTSGDQNGIKFQRRTQIPGLLNQRLVGVTGSHHRLQLREIRCHQGGTPIPLEIRTFWVY